MGRYYDSKNPPNYRKFVSGGNEMASRNLVILMGRLGGDPELKYTTSGTAVANFSLATTEYKKGSGDTREEVTEWHKVVIWGKLAETCNQYLKKGSMALVEGKIQTRNYEHKERGKIYVTEIIGNSVQFLSGKSETTQSAPKQEQPDLTDIPF